MARKTVDVDALRIKVNSMLANSTGSISERIGMFQVLEDVLLDSGNYKGFRYLTEAEVPEGFKPGINSDSDNSDTKFTNCDSTRIHYY